MQEIAKWKEVCYSGVQVSMYDYLWLICRADSWGLVSLSLSLSLCVCVCVCVWFINLTAVRPFVYVYTSICVYILMAFVYVFTCNGLGVHIQLVLVKRSHTKSFSLRKNPSKEPTLTLSVFSNTTNIQTHMHIQGVTNTTQVTWLYIPHTHYTCARSCLPEYR